MIWLENWEKEWIVSDQGGREERREGARIRLGLRVYVVRCNVNCVSARARVMKILLCSYCWGQIVFIKLFFFFLVSQELKE